MRFGSWELVNQGARTLQRVYIQTIFENEKNKILYNDHNFNYVNFFMKN